MFDVEFALLALKEKKWRYLSCFGANCTALDAPPLVSNIASFGRNRLDRKFTRIFVGFDKDPFYFFIKNLIFRFEKSVSSHSTVIWSLVSGFISK